MTAIPAPDVQHQLDALLEHLPAGVVVHGADGRIVSANRLACELLGQSIEQLQGAETSDWHFVQADGIPMPPEQFPVNVVLGSGKRLAHLIVGVQGAGEVPLRWLICNGYPEIDADGRLYQVVVCFTDCTELKRTERRLQESEERLRLVLRGSTDAPWDWDLVDGQIYYADRWWEMLGYRPGELEASPALWSALLHPDDRPAVDALMEDLFAGRRESYGIEFRLRRRDGDYLPVLSRGFVLRGADGRAVRISGTNTDLSERKAAERRIHELAYFDHLTGLPNRRLLVEELDKTLARSGRAGQFGALIFLDLDNFKLLNDTMGHDIGDQLLQQVAQRLRAGVRHGDQLARLGGDEFVVVLEELGSSAQEAAAATGHALDKLKLALTQPYQLSGRQFLSTSSMGVVLFDGASAGIDTLLRQADLAMYRAKADGRDTARFFDPEMQAAAEHQAALEHALREGLSLRQFVLFCQPQFSKDGQLVGAEVLVRWRRADGMLLAPGEFIGLAESSGLIVPLGQYVLLESCRALARWQGDPLLRGLDLAVNVSVHQLRSADFCGKVAEVLHETGAPSTRLCLELTESVFAEDMGRVIGRMQALCGLGLHFSLDDFGTGYSSLAYLRRFPLAALKIDRSFVQDVHIDPGAAPIVEAIIALARKLGLSVVAEGVEHEAQRRFLVERGCDGLQGFLLGRPMPIAEFEGLYGSGPGRACAMPAPARNAS